VRRMVQLDRSLDGTRSIVRQHHRRTSRGERDARARWSG
jgi:hypothetical protein